MGFNKRYVNSEKSLLALRNGKLKEYYGKSDALIFDDRISSKIFNLYCKGKNEQEILSIINKNSEENNEVY